MNDAIDRARKSYSDTVASSHPDVTGASAEAHSFAPHRTSGLKRVTMTAPERDESPPRESPPVRESNPPPSGDRFGQDPFLGYTIDDRYEVEAVLGEGGMGVVYRCRHTIIGKKVAMKVLRADMARSDEVVERFLNEARSASSIGNPHIIDISDFGRLPDGSTYFIMEFLEGQPLSAVVEGGPVPIQRLVHIAEQLAEGLFAAHEAGIVHRDLKPDNIFLVHRGTQKDFVKILDFGIAKASSTDGKLTQAGAVFGTPHYMSPEQAAGTPIDHRSDVYSFGVILYELASGRVPFDADNFMGILTQHMYKSPVPIRALVPETQQVPPGLEAVILKCLSKRPDHRYQTMYELLDDLKKIRGGQAPSAIAEMMSSAGGFNAPEDYFKSPRPHAGSPSRKWPLYLGIVGVGFAATLGAAALAPWAPSDVAPRGSAAAEPRVDAALPQSPTPPPLTAPAPQGPTKQQVALAVQPIEARVYRGQEDLGTSPVIVELAPGEKLDVVVRCPGYKDQPLTLDTTEPKRSVTLERATAPSAAPRSSDQRSSEQRSSEQRSSEKRAVAADSTARKSAAPKETTSKTNTPPAQTPRPPKPRLSPGSSDIVDPWATEKK